MPITNHKTDSCHKMNDLKMWEFLCYFHLYYLLIFFRDLGIIKNSIVLLSDLSSLEIVVLIFESTSEIFPLIPEIETFGFFYW